MHLYLRKVLVRTLPSKRLYLTSFVWSKTTLIQAACIGGVEEWTHIFIKWRLFHTTYANFQQKNSSGNSSGMSQQKISTFYVKKFKFEFDEHYLINFSSVLSFKFAKIVCCQSLYCSRMHSI